MSEHVVSVRTYTATFVALMVLLVLAVAAAWIEDPATNLIAALAIAVAKAVLIVLYFMHVRYATPLVRIVVISAVLGLALLLTITSSDVLTRNWPNAPASQAETDTPEM